MLLATKKPSNSFLLVISVTSDIDLPLSQICLFLTCDVCCEEIKSCKSFFSFSERAFDIIFRSHLIKKWVSGFLRISYLSFFFLLT